MPSCPAAPLVTSKNGSVPLFGKADGVTTVWMVPPLKKSVQKPAAGFELSARAETGVPRKSAPARIEPASNLFIDNLLREMGAMLPAWYEALITALHRRFINRFRFIGPSSSPANLEGDGRADPGRRRRRKDRQPGPDIPRTRRLHRDHGEGWQGGAPCYPATPACPRCPRLDAARAGRPRASAHRARGLSPPRLDALRPRLGGRPCLRNQRRRGRLSRQTL